MTNPFDEKILEEAYDWVQAKQKVASSRARLTHRYILKKTLFPNPNPEETFPQPD